jgi:hypothetical protein
MVGSNTKQVVETSKRDRSQVQWGLGLLAATVFSLLSIYPQVHLWVTRSESWQHAIAYNQGLGDEVAYAAYVNALIEGKPRRNDPYTGRGDGSDTRLPESLFSIQFVPAYALALPARVLGLSATTAFILVTPVVAFCSSLLVFWLLTVLTANSRLSGCGILLVLCLGTLVSGEGTVSSLLGTQTHFDFFPFLRRYEPAVCFPLLLLFFTLVCKFLAKRERPILWGILVGTTFATLVYSYFYLWTAAAAWFAIISILSLLVRREARRPLVVFITVVAAISVCASVPYFMMISSGLASVRTVQALVVSRKPDLLAPTVLIGAVVLIAIAYGVKRGLSFREHSLLAAASFGLLPFVVLNQQILTGHVLQPIHYKGFITSYSVLIAMVVTAGLNWRMQPHESEHYWQLSRRALLWLAIAAFDWGLIEAHQAMKRGAEGNNLAAQEMLVYTHFTVQHRAGIQVNADEVMLFDDLRMADGAPAVSPFPVLWAPHMIVYPGVNEAESKERLFRHLYYTGVGVKELDDYFHGRSVYYGCAVGLFGFDRLVDGLNPNAKPITSEEKKAELDSYKHFIETFDEKKAASPRLSYVIVPSDKTSMVNLDRWYRRDGGQQVGKFTVFRVELRDDLKGRDLTDVTLDRKTESMIRTGL